MSQSNEGAQGGQGGASTVSHEEILAHLKKEGVTDLDTLAKHAANMASQKDEQGNVQPSKIVSDGIICFIIQFDGE